MEYNSDITKQSQEDTNKQIMNTKKSGDSSEKRSKENGIMTFGSFVAKRIEDAKEKGHRIVGQFIQNRKDHGILARMDRRFNRSQESSKTDLKTKDNQNGEAKVENILADVNMEMRKNGSPTQSQAGSGS